MLSIPKRNRVQKYGFYSLTDYFCLVESSDDIKYCLENDLISKETCSQIYKWNKQIRREKWNMEDIEDILCKNFRNCMSRNFFYSNIKNLIELGVIEFVSYDAENGRLLRVTEKGEMVLKEVY